MHERRKDRKNDVKGSKPSSERQIPYDLTSKWNLINKTNKKEGEGSSRNMCKGPMDKAKGGRIEGGRRGWVGQGKVVARKWRQLYLNNKIERNR